MKKVLSILLILSLALVVAFSSSCTIVDDIQNAIVYPESYSITYQIYGTDGLVKTITKTVDENGNIYCKGAEKELLFMKENAVFTLYEKSEDGFLPKEDVKYTGDAVEKELDFFREYAERSTDKFIPTAHKTEETTLSGREVDVYELGVNLGLVSFQHLYYIDKESGVCLGVDVVNTVFGNRVEADEETFVCVEFITSNIDVLTPLN